MERAEGSAVGPAESFDVVLKGQPWGFTLEEGARRTEAVRIAEIMPNSTAADSNLLKGDEIICINDVACNSVADATDLIQSAFRTLTLTVRRGTVGFESRLTSPSLLLGVHRLKQVEKLRLRDDAGVMYSSKSNSGNSSLRMKPRRRGESFSVSRSFSSQKPVISTHLKKVTSDNELQLEVQQQQQQQVKLDRMSNLAKATPWTGSSDNLYKNILQGRQQLSPAKSTPLLSEDLTNQDILTNTSVMYGNASKSNPNINDRLDLERLSSPPKLKRPSAFKPGNSVLRSSPFYKNQWNREVKSQIQCSSTLLTKQVSQNSLDKPTVTNTGQRQVCQPLPLEPVQQNLHDYENMKSLQPEFSPISPEKSHKRIDDSSLRSEVPDSSSQPKCPEPLMLLPCSHPVPPVRDMSTKFSQSHEKYPSWPVTVHSSSVTPAAPVSVRAQSWSDHTNTSQEFPPKQRMAYKPGLTALKERVPEDMIPKTKHDPFARKPHDPNRFKDFYASKPGYPPPRFDSDGHNLGDKDYSAPSPPEREFSLSNHDLQSVNSGVYAAVPGRKGSAEPSLLCTESEPHGASMLSSPENDLDPMSFSKESPKDSQTFLVKQTPYYNTGTQTDYILSPPKPKQRKDNARHAEVQVGSTSEEQENSALQRGFEEKSTQVHLSWRGSESEESPEMSLDVANKVKQNFSSDKKQVPPPAGEKKGFPIHHDYTPSTAPMLRWLSEEFYKHGSFGKHSSSGSFSDQQQSSTPLVQRTLDSSPQSTGMTEAESYSSIIIHSSEPSSPPFGSDDHGSRYSLSSLDSQCQSSVREEYSITSRCDASRRHQPGRYSMDTKVAKMQQPLFMESNNGFMQQSKPHLNGKIHKMEKIGNFEVGQKQFDAYRKGQQNPYLAETSEVSAGSQPLKYSGTNRVLSHSESSPFMKPAQKKNVEPSNDSPFMDDEPSASTSMQSGENISPGTKFHVESKKPGAKFGRNLSMKRAFGTFDENEKMFSSSPIKDTKQKPCMCSPSESLSQSHSDVHSFGQIAESSDGGGMKWEEAVNKAMVKSRSLSQTFNISGKSSRSMTDLHRIKGEQKVLKGHILKSWKNDVDRANEPSLVGKTSRSLSENAFQKVPQEKHLDPLLSASSRAVESKPRKQSKGKSEKKPNYKQSSPIQKTDTDCHQQPHKKPPNKNRSCSFSENSAANFEQGCSMVDKPKELPSKPQINGWKKTSPRKDSDSDYVDMTGRQQSRRQTEWSRIRSQSNGSTDSSSLKKTDLSKLKSSESAQDLHQFSAISQQILGNQRLMSRDLNKDELTFGQKFKGPNLNSGDTTAKLAPSSRSSLSSDSQSPTYQNMPSLLPRSSAKDLADDDQPPELPPRHYHISSLESDDNLPKPWLSFNHYSAESQSIAGNPTEQFTYADQLRQRSRRFSEQQAYGMNVIRTKQPLNITESKKRVPMRPQEAVPLDLSPASSKNQDLDKVSTRDVSTEISSTTKRTSSAIHGSSPSLNSLYSEERSKESGPSSLKLDIEKPLASVENGNNQDSPMPSPPDFDDVIRFNDNEVLPPPPPPESFAEATDDDYNISEKYSDGSYGSYRTNRTNRQIGIYKRSVSDVNVEQALDHFVQEEAAKKLEDQTWKSEVDLNNAELHNKNEQPPSWHPNKSISNGLRSKSSTDCLVQNGRSAVPSERNGQSTPGDKVSVRQRIISFETTRSYQHGSLQTKEENSLSENDAAPQLLDSSSLWSQGTLSDSMTEDRRMSVTRMFGNSVEAADLAHGKKSSPVCDNGEYKETARQVLDDRISRRLVENESITSADDRGECVSEKRKDLLFRSSQDTGLHPAKSKKGFDTKKNVEISRHRAEEQRSVGRVLADSHTSTPTGAAASDNRSKKANAKKSNIQSQLTSPCSTAARSSNSETSPGAASQKQLAKKIDGKLVVHHARVPSQEELECEKQANVLAQKLDDSDKKLSEVLNPNNKSAMDFMGGLFDDTFIASRQQGPKRLNSPKSTSAIKDSSQKKRKPEGFFIPLVDALCRCWHTVQGSRGERIISPQMPSEYYMSATQANLQIKMKELDKEAILKDMGENTESLMQKKEDLLYSIVKKLEVLQEAKTNLEGEIAEVNNIGLQIAEVVDTKCKNQNERDKYKAYVEDLEKVIRLLLKLSGLLARAENAVQSLPQNADQQKRKMAVDKRDRIYSQHEEAKKIKSDIERRSQQVFTILNNYLTEQELNDYKYFVAMKSKLIIEQHEVEDKVILGKEQLQALQRSIPEKDDR